MIFGAWLIQSFVLVNGSLPCAKDDLDIPTTAVKLTNRTSFECVSRNVGDDEVPMTSKALGFTQGFASFSGALVCFSQGFFGHGGDGFYYNKTGLVFFAAKAHLEFKGFFLASAQILVEFTSFGDFGDEL